MHIRRGPLVLLVLRGRAMREPRFAGRVAKYRLSRIFRTYGIPGTKITTVLQEGRKTRFVLICPDVQIAVRLFQQMTIFAEIVD